MPDKKKTLSDMLNAADGYDRTSILPLSMEGATPAMLRRICALKKLQLEGINIETKFYEKVHELEAEFQPLFDAVHAKRTAIIAGSYEPTDSECDAPLINDLPDEAKERIDKEAAQNAAKGEKVGVSEFWYHCMNNTTLADIIQDHDRPILAFLNDISTEVHMNPPGFTLNFHFAKNSFFKNEVLSKYYELRLGVDPECPFEYDGPTVAKCKGTSIDWYEGKNVTEKVVKKKQKRGPNAGRFLTKTVTSDSFFNFFNPNEMNPDSDANDTTLQEAIQQDFELGQIIRDQLIPRAVLYFTGDASDNDEDDLYDEYDDEEDEPDPMEDDADSEASHD